jgi:putative permease
MPTRTSRGMTDLIILLIIVTAVAAVLVLGGVAEVVIISLLLAYILDPLANALERAGLSRTLATVVIFLAFVFILALVGAFLIPALLDQVQALQSGSASEQATLSIGKLQETVTQKLSPLGLGDVNLIQMIQEFRGYISQKVIDFLLQDSLALIVKLVMIPFVMFFLLKEGRDMKKSLVELVPNRYFEFSLDLLYKMDLQLGNYLRGQFIDALVFGALATVALWVLGVKYFLFIGIFAGLANLIPFVGPIAGMLLGAVAAVLETGDVMQGIWVVVAFVGLKLIDDFVVQPLAVGKSVDLHPMLVALAILTGGHLFGTLGMLLAVPVAGFLKVVLMESIVTYRKYRFA